MISCFPAECPEPCLAVTRLTWKYLEWLEFQRKQSRRRPLQTLEVQHSIHVLVSAQSHTWVILGLINSHHYGLFLILCLYSCAICSVGLDEQQRAKMARLAAPPLPAGQPGAMPPSSHNGYYNPRCAATRRTRRKLLFIPLGSPISPLLSIGGFRPRLICLHLGFLILLAAPCHAN